MTTKRGIICLDQYILDAYDVEVKPHSSNIELFESYAGIVAIKKMMDHHVELKFKAILTENNVPGYQPGTDPELYRDDFVTIRRNFLKNVDGQVVIVSSEMFEPFRGLVTAREYKIGTGETAAEYSIEIREVIPNAY